MPEIIFRNWKSSLGLVCDVCGIVRLRIFKKIDTMLERLLNG